MAFEPKSAGSEGVSWRDIWGEHLRQRESLSGCFQEQLGGLEARSAASWGVAGAGWEGREDFELDSAGKGGLSRGGGGNLT